MDILFLLMMLFAALLQICILSLLVLFIYRIFINKQIAKKQVAGVLAWISVVHFVIAVMAYRQDKDMPLTWAGLIIYLFVIFGMGLLVAQSLRVRA